MQIDSKSNSLTASKIEKSLIIKRVDVKIQLDADDRVVSVDTTTHLTGP
jgi:hypothetical protein